MDWKFNSPVERMFGDYFEKNASEDLKRRVEEQKKTPQGALAYVTAQARKEKSSGNCACVPDEVVFGWLMHYFEDEDASKWEGKAPSASVKVSAPSKKTEDAKPAKPQKPDNGQMSLF